MPAMAHQGRKRTSEVATRVSDARPQREGPIDWAHLSRFTLNDRNLEHEVLGLFAAEAPRYLAKMYAARSRKEWVEAAHTLKGSARAVGAWAIAECAQAAETLQLSARAPQTGMSPGSEPINLDSNRGLRQALEKLADAVHSTLAYIEQLRSPVAPTDSGTRGP